MGIRRARRGVVAALVLATVWLTVPMHAEAAVGDLSWSGCLANDATQGCTDVPGAPLYGASGVAVGPDGTSVYVTSQFADSVSHLFAIGPQGQLSWDGCLANDGTQGCGDVPAAPLDSASGVAVSPDGKSVYVASRGSGSVSHLFATGPQGQLSWDGCLANNNFQNCADLPDAPVDGANAVAASPDGKSIYLTSSFANSVSHLFATGPQGQISWDSCLNDTGTQGCGDVPQAPLQGPSSVAVSPDGKSLYVTSPFANSVSHLFASGPQGQISWDGCLNNDGSQNCADLPGAPLTGAIGVAVSPDGTSLYVTSYANSSIAKFTIGLQGQLTYVGCLNNDGSEGCTDLPAAPLSGARGVAVSPDGKSVYVASPDSNSVVHFSITSPQGLPSYAGCLADDGTQGCMDLPGAPLTGASAVAVTRDGKSVYVASTGSDSVSHFFREVPAAPLPPEPGTTPPLPPEPGTTPPPTGGTGPGVSCSGKRATEVGTTGPDRLRGTRRRDVIAALGGNDTVRGLAGNDLICGGKGKDRLIGGAGNDRLLGGAGSDRLLGGRGRDQLRGGVGRDRLIGGPGRDREAQ